MKIGRLLLATYLGTSPVFWFWNLPPRVVLLTKWLLILAGFAVIWLRAYQRRLLVLPVGLSGPNGFVLLVVSMAFGFFQSGAEAILETVADIVYPFLTIWTVFLYYRLGGDLVRLFKSSAIIFLPFAMLTVSAGVLGIPDWSVTYSGREVSIVTSGFTDKRTGWSNGTALFVPILLMGLATVQAHGQRLFYAISVLIFIGSQAVVGGRAGLLASLVAVFIWLAGRVRRWVYIVPLALVVLLLGTNESVLQHLRLNRVAAVSSLQDLDQLSSSRISRNIIAIGYVLQSPLQGYGFGSLPFTEFQDPSFVHNLWLKLWLQAGLFAPAALAAIVAHLFLKAVVAWRRVSSRAKWSARHEEILGATSVLVIGLIISMLEPSYLIGAFQTSVLWWTAAGAIVSWSSTYGLVVTDDIRKRSENHLRSYSSESICAGKKGVASMLS